MISLEDWEAMSRQKADGDDAAGRRGACPAAARTRGPSRSRSCRATRRSATPRCRDAACAAPQPHRPRTGRAERPGRRIDPPPSATTSKTSGKTRTSSSDEDERELTTAKTRTSKTRIAKKTKYETTKTDDDESDEESDEEIRRRVGRVEEEDEWEEETDRKIALRCSGRHSSRISFSTISAGSAVSSG